MFNQNQFIQTNSNEPEVFFDLVTKEPTKVGEHIKDKVVIFAQSWTHKLIRGTLIEVECVVLDQPAILPSNYALAMGNSLVVEFPTTVVNWEVGNELKNTAEGEMTNILPNALFVVSLDEVIFSSGELVKRESRRRDIGSRVEETTELLNKHLDDLINQANILKESDNPLIRGDAYARIRFAMERLDRIETAGFYGQSRRMSRRPGVDMIYSAEDNSYRTPDGNYHEDTDERSARMWRGRDVARGDLAGELTEEHDNAIHRRGQFWQRNDSRTRPSEERYMREHGRRGRNSRDED